MALISILAKNSHILNWEDLYLKITNLELDDVEIFPIPSELGFKENAFGFSISKNYKSKTNAETQLRKLFFLLTLHDFKMVDLYTGIDITEKNLSAMFSRLSSR